MLLCYVADGSGMIRRAWVDDEDDAFELVHRWLQEDWPADVRVGIQGLVQMTGSW